MSTDLMNVSAFKGLAPAGAFAALDPHSESLADGIGSSYGIIGYKGKVWSLRLRGETYIFTRADDGSPAAFLDVIILRSPGYKSKSYYPPGTFVDGSLGTRPVCAALDGATPDADILEPQSPACATCPKNVFKLNAEGRKTRDCSDYKRLAVLILPSMTKALLGAALMEPVFLRVPAASLNDLAQLGEAMSGQGFHYSSYITRIGFNPEKPHPQMTFRALQALTDREAPMVLPLREDNTALRITGENETSKTRATYVAPAAAITGVSGSNPDLAAQQAAEHARLAAKAQAEADALKAAQVAAAQEVARKAAADLAAKQAAEAAAKAAAAAQVDTGLVDTGFGDIGADPAPVTATVTATAATPAPTTVVSDTGAPEDADAELDAKIAALLPK